MSSEMYNMIYNKISLFEIIIDYCLRLNNEKEFSYLQNNNFDSTRVPKTLRLENIFDYYLKHNNDVISEIQNLCPLETPIKRCLQNNFMDDVNISIEQAHNRAFEIINKPYMTKNVDKPYMEENVDKSQTNITLNNDLGYVGAQRQIQRKRTKRKHETVIKSDQDLIPPTDNLIKKKIMYHIQVMLKIILTLIMN